MNVSESRWRFIPLIAAGMIFTVSGIADEILENDFLKVKVTERGGKAVSVFDKTTNRELVNGTGIYGGIGKSRDGLFQNIETLTGKFKLSKPSREVVKAVYDIANANLGGMMLERTFRLCPDATVLEITERWKSLKKENSFAINFHNSFQFSPDTFFYIPSRSGLAETGSRQAKINKLNMVSDLLQPWIAGLEQKNGHGTALYINEARQLESLYHWADDTLEANFRQLTLKPIAASDEWTASALVIPFSGKGRVVSVTPDAVLTLDGSQGTVYFLRKAGKSEVMLNGKKLDSFDIRAGASYCFNAEKKGDLFFVTPNRQIKVTIPANLKFRKPLTKEPPRQEIGINGFYYYYPELYLSPEIDAEISVGLRGNFRARKNFRFAIALPPGVDITYSRYKILRSGNIVIDGQKLCRYEIISPRTNSYYAALNMNLKSDRNFKENSAAYIQALWDGGEQIPEKIVLKQIPKLPDIGKGLTYLSISLGDTTSNPGPPLGDSKSRPVPQWSKFGVNGFEFWDWTVPVFHNNFLGKDFYKDRLKAFSSAGLECAIELGSAFSQSDNVMKGEFLEGAGTLFHPVKRKVKLDPDEFRAIDINGNQTDMVCPSYRGVYFEKSLDSLKTAVAYGFNHVIYDEEGWRSGAILCHCKRCLKKFGKNPAAHPEEWQEFKTDQVADLYRRFRETIGEKRIMSVWLDIGLSDGAPVNRLTDYRKIALWADNVMPMYYTDASEEIGKYAKIASEKIKGGRANLIMGLAPNRTYEYYRIPSGNLASPDAEKEQIFESVFNGARGVIFWAHRSTLRGALGAYNIAQAVKELIPVEEIIVKGKPVSVPNTNPDVKVTAYDYNGEIAVFARNYDHGIVKSTVCNHPIVFDKTRTIIMKVKE